MKRINAIKLISVILVIAVMIPVISCGKKAAQTPTPTPTTIATPTATAPAEPTGETGTLSGMEGDVQVLRQGASAWIAATSGMKIGTGDGLKTGSNGYVLITFFDGSVMEVESDSEISVEELSNASGGATTVRINQMLGNTLNRVENIVDSSSTYEVETPVGSAVVRGTFFGMLVDRYGELFHACTSCFNQGDNKEHSVDFGPVKVPVDMTSCWWEGSAPGAPFFTNSANDPLLYVGDSGGGGSFCNWTGTWCTDYGTMVLVQTGNEVMGTYNYSDGECQYYGGILGNVSGNMLTGMWGEQALYCEGGVDYGDFEFTMLGDCTSFSGRYEDEGEWYDDWSGTRGKCPADCCTCPDYDSELNTPGCPPQYIADSFDVGGCRWYRVYLEESVKYGFAMCGDNEGYYGSYDGGDPVIEIYDSYCELLEYSSSSCGEGEDNQISYTCEQTGYYFLKVHEYGDDATLNYILAYFRLTGCA